MKSIGFKIRYAGGLSAAGMYFMMIYLDVIASCTLTRFAQPHVHTYIFCPYVISTLFWLLEECK
jgi:hypothetical protein